MHFHTFTDPADGAISRAAFPERFAQMIDVEIASSMEAAPPKLPRADCPDCGAPLAQESGCAVCRTCGHSACG